MHQVSYCKLWKKFAHAIFDFTEQIALHLPLEFGAMEIVKMVNICNSYWQRGQLKEFCRLGSKCVQRYRITIRIRISTSSD